jgi:hypothetical protein
VTASSAALPGCPSSRTRPKAKTALPMFIPPLATGSSCGALYHLRVEVLASRAEGIGIDELRARPGTSESPLDVR